MWWPELPGNGKSVLTVTLNSGLTVGGAAAILLLKPLLTAAGVLAITQRAPVWAGIFVWEPARPPWWLLLILLVAALAADRCDRLRISCVDVM